jgi:hypothetical protein
MMFLDCAAYLDHERTVRCGLPAEVRCRFTMRSTDGPLEAAMISCPAGHYFSGLIESLTWDSTDKHDPGTAAASSRAARDGSGTSVMAVTAGPGSLSGICPQGRSRESPARTPLRPTTWGGPPACGSPRTARAPGDPHPARCTLSPAAGNERRSGTGTPSPAPGPEQPA